MEGFRRGGYVGSCRVLHFTRYAWARARAHNALIDQPYITLHRWAEPAPAAEAHHAR